MTASDERIDDDRPAFGALDVVASLLRHVRLLVFVPLAIGLIALGLAFLMTPVFTGRTMFLPPQQPQSTVASSLQSLGAAAALAGGALNIRSPAEQYVSLMHSVAVYDRIIDRFGLHEQYGEKYRVYTRRALAEHVRIGVGRRDNLITVEVDDPSPQKAADMANAFVEELRRLTGRLALTEAQQRRVFFERQLQETKQRLTQAQVALQGSGITQGALKAEPKSAAEAYARLRAEVTAAEVRVQSLRASLVDGAPELQQALGALGALRAQLGKAEQTIDGNGDADYVGKYREFKYQETLFELFSRQYEMARADESREGTLIQVVDVAAPPDRKSKPVRSLIAVGATLVSGLLLAVFFVLRDYWRIAGADPRTAGGVARLREAWRGL